MYIVYYLDKKTLKEEYVSFEYWYQAQSFIDRLSWNFTRIVDTDANPNKYDDLRINRTK